MDKWDGLLFAHLGIGWPNVVAETSENARGRCGRVQGFQICSEMSLLRMTKSLLELLGMGLILSNHLDIAALKLNMPIKLELKVGCRMSMPPGS